jgi:D-alanine-D-alanine ligase
MASRVPELTDVVVLMGGWSVEREVSLASGKACTKALEEVGFRVTQVDPRRDIAEVLAALKPDVVFNALHGRWGEDGTLQGILETLEIPYTHSGVLASALAMDKPRAKEIFRAAGVPVVEHKVVDIETAATTHVIAPPYVIKPANEGSSVGVHIVHAGANAPLTSLLDHRTVYGASVMVERFIPGRELTCAVMGNVALGVIEIQPAVGFYDYRAKYAPAARRICCQRRSRRRSIARSSNTPSTPICRWAAAASAAPISAMTTGPARSPSSIFSRSTPNRG